jgi:hypothetical protein
MTWVERIFYMLAVVVLACFLMREGCKDPVVCPDVQPMVITGTHDTVYVPTPGPVIPSGGKTNKITVAGKSGVKVFAAPPYIGSDSLSGEDWLVEPEAPEQCAVRLYQDTLHFGEDGYAIVKDTVAGLILNRSFSWSLNKQMITKEVVKFYLGLEYAYPMNYTGAAGLIQFKNQNVLRVAAGRANDKWQFGGSYFLNLSQ